MDGCGLAEAAADTHWAWRTAAGDTPEEMYDLWRHAVDRSRAAMAKVLADGGLSQPAKYTTSRDHAPKKARAPRLAVAGGSCAGQKVTHAG